jgi:hypothetical protein
LRAAGGATDLRAAGGATDLRAAGGATDLRAAAEDRMELGARSEARPNGAPRRGLGGASGFARDFIERLAIAWCIRMIADAP